MLFADGLSLADAGVEYSGGVAANVSPASDKAAYLELRGTVLLLFNEYIIFILINGNIGLCCG